MAAMPEKKSLVGPQTAPMDDLANPPRAGRCEQRIPRPEPPKRTYPNRPLSMGGYGDLAIWRKKISRAGFLRALGGDLRGQSVPARPPTLKAPSRPGKVVSSRRGDPQKLLGCKLQKNWAGIPVWDLSRAADDGGQPCR